MKSPKTKVMLVDDHAIMRDSLAFMIEGLGIGKICGTAANGKEFLNLLEKTIPDIVILDIIMPEMNGIEAAQKAKAIYPGLKIIIVSMFNDFNVYSGLIKLGINGFILKDSEASEIKNAIETVMKGDSYFTKELLLSIVKHNQNNIQVYLSEREKEILRLICMGLSNEEIADKLHVGKRTIEKNRSELLKKTGCLNSVSLVLYSIKNKIVDINDGSLKIQIVQSVRT